MKQLILPTLLDERRIKPLISDGICGRPTGLDLQRQKRRKAVRCQLISVAGLTITNALRQSKKQASLARTKRSVAVVLVTFFSRSWNKASYLRRNRFSAASALRLRSRAAQKSRKSARTICAAIVSFARGSNTLSTSKWSHSYLFDFARPFDFCGPHLGTSIVRRLLARRAHYHQQILVGYVWQDNPKCQNVLIV